MTSWMSAIPHRCTRSWRIFCLFAASACCFALAQDDSSDLPIPPAHYPRLVEQGADAAAFVPKGWALRIQASGDLNGDGKPDLAFVLQQTDPHNVLHKDPKGAGMRGFIPEDGLDTNPRILCVAVRNASGGYTLVAQNHTFIPRWTEPTQTDPFETDGQALGLAGAGFVITRGTLQVTLGYFATFGGWSTGENKFTFRLSGSALQLIGFDNENLNRGTLDDTTSSVNYLTGRVVLTSGNDNSKAPTRQRIRSLPRRPLKTIDQIGDGMDFDYPQWE